MRLVVFATLLVGIAGNLEKLSMSKIVFFFGSSLLDNHTYPLDHASDVLEHPRFCYEKPTVLYINGWRASTETIDVKSVVAAYLPRADHNVMVLDWQKMVHGPNAASAVPHTMAFGPILADVLLKMTTNGFNLSSLHLVAHSLGCHLAGKTGREIQRKSQLKLTRITALDPAKPLFYPSIGTEHICADDADLVDVIHTDAGLKGAPVATGTIDFWPNGGSHQPACVGENYKCAHDMAWRYYVERTMFANSTFLARQCDSWDSYMNGDCDSNQQASMGINEMRGMSGCFYLHVNSMALFSRTEENELNHSEQQTNDVTYNWSSSEETSSEYHNEIDSDLYGDYYKSSNDLRTQKKNTLVGHAIGKKFEILGDVRREIKNVRQVLPLAVIKRVLSKN